MRRLKWIIIFFIFFLLGCGGGGGGSGGGSNDNGSGGSEPPEELKLPAIVGDGYADYYLIRIKGNLEKIESPLIYPVDGFEQGIYFFQIQAVRSEQSDYPVNFNLIVIEYDDYISYEILPKNWEENFNQENLIWP